jgi:23S rRNA (cytidine1920-2'-O)/16S rRNA (cytidine1409-2'-O)-methyltransferase
MKKKAAIIDRLLDERWFDDEKEAAAWIMERKVLVKDKPVLTPKEQVPFEAVIRLKNEYKRRYVNKGGLKLEGALQRLNISVEGKTALDCGASTGGFTDCLIQKGASRVYAVDAGFGQLAGRLRIEPRVVNLEKTNLGDRALLNLEPKPELITLDLSYLSLRKALPLCEGILNGEGQVVCLVKPLFEVENPEVRRSGELTDTETLRDILMGLYDFFVLSGYKAQGLTYSSVTGNEGTIEYFYAIAMGGSSKGLDREEIEPLIADIVNISRNLVQFKK